MDNSIIKKSLDKIESFLYHKYNVGVVYLRDEADTYYQNLERVEINSRQNFKSRLHSLLHEAGHVVLRNGGHRGEGTFCGRFPNMNTVNRDRYANMAHRVDVLREEVLAWEEAEKIAIDLSIELDKDLWNKHRYSALASYVNWAVKK